MSKSRYLVVAVILLVICLVPVLVEAADPEGKATYGSEDTVAGVKIAVNFSWTLLSGFLVFFMQAGFALLGAGLIRSKNTLNYLTKSYMDFSAGAIAYWAFGFALMFGGSKLAPGLESGNPWIGYGGFFPLRRLIRCLHGYAMALPNGFRGDGSYHSGWRRSGTAKVSSLLAI